MMETLISNELVYNYMDIDVEQVYATFDRQPS